ncbi:DNA mismatch endonuclease Vsr [Methylobacterium oryzihabitans]|uniref:DNA mismatch endonuclease Vsr n=2 Tax=Methylobacterium oryzihabitans TaxID=2499852 RepID=A0A3S2V7E9_9HYPH|nr:DNA mismatch endonuclease Vsr [Methylobacterium oryzihabitans]
MAEVVPKRSGNIWLGCRSRHVQGAILSRLVGVADATAEGGKASRAALDIVDTREPVPHLHIRSRFDRRRGVKAPGRKASNRAGADQTARPRPPRPSEAGRFEGVTEATRKVMRANKGSNTKPEMIVRRLLHGLGYRYRVHRKDLPGKPDVAFGPRKKAIFVHGCFWHAHDAAGCKIASRPKSRTDFWEGKFVRNKERDARNVAALEAAGWQVLVVWECELGDSARLGATLTAFLND